MRMKIKKKKIPEQLEEIFFFFPISRIKDGEKNNDLWKKILLFRILFSTSIVEQYQGNK